MQTDLVVNAITAHGPVAIYDTRTKSLCGTGTGAACRTGQYLLGVPIAVATYATDELRVQLMEFNTSSNKWVLVTSATVGATDVADYGAEKVPNLTVVYPVPSN